MTRRLVSLILSVLAVGAAGAGRAAPGLPFDEQTLDRIDALNRAITEHYEALQSAATDLDARRTLVSDRLEAIGEELVSLDRSRARLEPTVDDDDPALRYVDDRRLEAKSRYLEALAEKHAIDLETTRAFEVHATGILQNLERLAEALERSGRLAATEADGGTREALHSLQRGTAIALTVLEEWGTLDREDPRFRALWATSRVLNRNVRRMQAGEGVRMTVDLVQERVFVVRSLIDQARALRAALDQQGLLLQVAAQNQMLRLHFTRLGAINGLELPDLDLEDSTRRILEDIEEEPFGVDAADSGDAMGGFDACVQRGICN
jgi:hypothetical protein